MSNTELLLRVALLNILWIWGFYVSCKVEFHDDENPQLGYNKRSRMRLWFIKKWSLETFGEHESKGICTCPVCMPGYWSLPFLSVYCALAHLPVYWIILIWLVYCPCLVAINYVLSLIIGKLENG